MKRIMRRIVAAVLAMGCLPVAGVTASAVDMPWYWGTATNNAFEGLTPVNTYDWLQEKDCQVYLKDTDSEKSELLFVYPRNDCIRIVLREDTDEAAEAVVDVMEQYFPEIRASLNLETFAGVHERWYNSDGQYGDWAFNQSGNVYELYLTNPGEDAAALETNLLRDLAKAHLISAYYGLGATAMFSTGYVVERLLDYPETYGVMTGEDQLTKHEIDWDAVQTYLDEHHPDCRVEGHEIITPDTMTFKEKFELACELKAIIHLGPSVLIYASDATILGHNALESPGDVTLDCELDILDVIAANKYLLGAEMLCDTAKTNADINADGTPDETDSLTILKEVVGITENFEQK